MVHSSSLLLVGRAQSSSSAGVCYAPIYYSDLNLSFYEFLTEHLQFSRRFESVANVLDDGAAPAGRPSDGDDVESGRVLEQVVSLQKSQCAPGDMLLFLQIDRLGRMAGSMRAAGLDLDEDDRSAVDGDQIQLTQRVAIAAPHDLVAESAQEPFGGRFSASTQRHGPAKRRDPSA